MYRAILFAQLFPREHFHISYYPNIDTRICQREAETPEQAFAKAVAVYNPHAIRMATWQPASGLVFVNNVACGMVFKIEK